jgi:hypothetical protein
MLGKSKNWVIAFVAVGAGQGRYHAGVVFGGGVPSSARRAL